MLWARLLDYNFSSVSVRNKNFSEIRKARPYESRPVTELECYMEKISSSLLKITGTKLH